MIKEYISYLKDNPRKLWFKAKLYGWGWTPATWQGWLVLSVYILLLIWFFRGIDSISYSTKDTFTGIFAPFIILTSLLILICYKKGEKPRWQWGPPDKNKQV